MGPENLPFWMDFTPSLSTVLCVAGLSVLAAAIAGGLPAWHASVQARPDRRHAVVFGSRQIASATLHPLALLYVASGSAMISTIRIPKP
jgi:hypothetical protein